MTFNIEGTASPRWPVILERFGKLLPRYPALWTYVPVAQVPPPPRLDTEKKDTWPLRLARSYANTTSEWFGKCLHTDDHACVRRFCEVVRVARCDGPVVGYRALATLQRAADQMHAYSISPIAWCAFSCVIWSRHGKKIRGRAGRPTHEWVFSKVRLNDRRDWFEWKDGIFRGGQIVLEPLHRELFERYDRMHWALMDAENLDSEKVRAIVSEYLSAVWYAGTLEKLEALTVAKKNEFRRRSKNDEWLWL